MNYFLLSVSLCENRTETTSLLYTSVDNEKGYICPSPIVTKAMCQQLVEIPVFGLAELA